MQVNNLDNDVNSLILRRFTWYGAEKYGLAGKLARFEALLREQEKSNKCTSSDIIAHYVDSIFMRLYDNMSTALKIKSRYETLEFKDIDDPVVSQNTYLLPMLFGYKFSYCPVTGGTCASSPSQQCVSLYFISGAPACCVGNYLSFGGLWMLFTDNAPWVNQYSTGENGISLYAPTTPGVVSYISTVSPPSCFPSTGVTVKGPIIASGTASQNSGTCATSCPSGSYCFGAPSQHCPGTSWTTLDFPLVYATATVSMASGVNYTVILNYEFL